MSKKYNVLWIDDEHESMTALHRTAIDFDITLHPFKSMNGGCAEFERNYTKYDAVLFDAKFFENESDHPGSEDTKWVHQAKDRIRDVDRSIEFFVLTGQAEAYDSREFKNAFPHVFNKGVGGDEDELFEMLVNACENRELTTLKHKYPNPIEFCTEAYIGSKHFDRIIEIIKDIENPDEIVVAQDMLTPMRKILEALFEKLNDLGIIPDKIKNSQGWISGSSKFLAGKNHAYEYKENIIPPIIAEGIHRLLNLSQDGSHNTGHKLNADDYLAKSSSHYLYLSCTYLLFDILDEMKSVIDANQDVNKNKEKYKFQEVIDSTNDYEGKITQDARGNYHCGKYLLNEKYVESKNHMGMKIKITQSSENGISSLKDMFPYFANRYEVIS